MRNLVGAMSDNNDRASHCMIVMIEPVTLWLGVVTGILAKGPSCDQAYPHSPVELLFTSDVFYHLNALDFSFQGN